MVLPPIILADASPTQAATTITMDGWHVFLSWVMTPTGAVLALLLIGLAVASGVMQVMGRGVRVLGVCVKIVAALLFVWIVGGILEAWGIPVRETISYLGSQLPTLIGHAAEFIGSLFSVAG